MIGRDAQTNGRSRAVSLVTSRELPVRLYDDRMRLVLGDLTLTTSDELFQPNKEHMKCDRTRLTLASGRSQ